MSTTRKQQPQLNKKTEKNFLIKDWNVILPLFEMKMNLLERDCQEILHLWVVVVDVDSLISQAQEENDVEMNLHLLPIEEGMLEVLALPLHEGIKLFSSLILLFIVVLLQKKSIKIL